MDSGTNSLKFPTTLTWLFLSSLLMWDGRASFVTSLSTPLIALHLAATWLRWSASSLFFSSILGQDLGATVLGSIAMKYLMQARSFGWHLSSTQPFRLFLSWALFSTLFPSFRLVFVLAYSRDTTSSLQSSWYHSLFSTLVSSMLSKILNITF